MGGRSFCLLYILWFVFMNILSTNAIVSYTTYFRYYRYVPKDELKNNMDYRCFNETNTFYKKVRDEIFSENNGIYKNIPHQGFWKTPEYANANLDSTHSIEVKIDHIEPFLDHGVKVFLNLNIINYTSTSPQFEEFSDKLKNALENPVDNSYFAQQKRLYKDQDNANSYVKPSEVVCAPINFGQVDWPALLESEESNIMCPNSWRIDQYMVRKCLNGQWQPIDRSKCTLNFMNYYRFFLKVSPVVKPPSFLNNSKLMNQIQNELDLDKNIPPIGFSKTSKYANTASSHSFRLEVDRIEPFGGLDIRVMVKVHINNYTVMFPTFKEFSKELKETLENPVEGSYLARVSSLYSGTHKNKYYIERQTLRCYNIHIKSIYWPVLAENEESHTMCLDAVDIEQYMVMKCLKGRSRVKWQPIDMSRCWNVNKRSFRFFMKVDNNLKPAMLSYNSTFFNKVHKDIDSDNGLFQTIPRSGFSNSATAKYSSITSGHSISLVLDRLEPYGEFLVRVFVTLKVIKYTTTNPAFDDYSQKELQVLLENPSEGSYLARETSRVKERKDVRFYLSRSYQTCSREWEADIYWPALKHDEESHNLCPDAINVTQFMVRKCLNQKWTGIDRKRCPLRAVTVDDKSSKVPYNEPLTLTCNCKFLPFFNNASQTFTGYDAVRGNCEKMNPSLECIDKKCGDGSEKSANPKAVLMLEKLRVFCDGKCSYHMFSNCLGKESLEEKEKKKPREPCVAMMCARAWLFNCKNGEMYRDMSALLKFKIDSQIEWVTKECTQPKVKHSVVLRKAAATSSTNALLPLSPSFLISTTSLVLTLTLPWSVVTKF